MRGQPTKEAHYSYTGIRRSFRAECLSYPAGCMLPPRNLAGTARHIPHNRRGRYWLPCMETQAKMLKAGLI